MGLAATFARWKGHSLFLEAARLIIKAFPTAGFLIIGGDIYDSGGEKDYKAHLTSLARQAGLQDRLLFTGFQTEVAPWYRALDVVVNASLKPEPFGRTLLEAMACGRAVVGPRAGGIPEFVSHGHNGLLYEMGNVTELAAATLTLLRSTDLRDRLGRAGRETVLHSFAPEAHATLVARVFRQALG